MKHQIVIDMEDGDIRVSSSPKKYSSAFPEGSLMARSCCNFKAYTAEISYMRSLTIKQVTDLINNHLEQAGVLNAGIQE